MFTSIEKRNGEIVFFDRSKIEEAIVKALKATKPNRTGTGLFKLAEVATDYLLERLEKQSIDIEVPKVEDIQDAVEEVLMAMGEHETARNYIKYRYEHKRKREKAQTVQEILGFFDDYMNQNDWRVKEHFNTGYSLQGLNNHVVEKATQTFWLHHVYSEGIRKGHESGEFHIHDLGLLSTYCCGWSLEELLLKGFGGVFGKVQAAPPKHFETALMQLSNFIFTLQGEAAGAQAVSNFDTLLAPFVRSDNLTYNQVKQSIQTFVFNLNVTTRGGFQTPFFNIAFDRQVPRTHQELPIIIGGIREYNHTYGMFQAEMDMINLAFCEVMMAGDALGRIFTFPIPTYNVTDEWQWDHPVTDKIMEMTGKYGIPYFSNFIHSVLDPEDVRGMSSRLRLNNKELLHRGGGLFGANPKTGSIGVVTINLARIGYTAQSMEMFFYQLEYAMILAKESLETKREVLEMNMHKGLYPYSKHYLKDAYETSGEYWTNHFSTIGPCGVNECILNFTKGSESIASSGGKAFAEEILEFMNELLLRFQQETGHLFNLEATPAEGAAYRFAKLDKQRYNDIITSGTEEAPYYTNSTQLPVGQTSDIFDALDHQDSLQCKYTGGTVFHAFMAERIESKQIVKQLIKTIAEQYKLPYFTITPTFSICPEHGYLNGEMPVCPYCGKKTEIWSRVLGYHQPVQNCTDEKLQEFKDRQPFAVEFVG